MSFSAILPHSSGDFQDNLQTPPTLEDLDERLLTLESKVGWSITDQGKISVLEGSGRDIENELADLTTYPIFRLFEKKSLEQKKIGLIGLVFSKYSSKAKNEFKDIQDEMKNTKSHQILNLGDSMSYMELGKRVLLFPKKYPTLKEEANAVLFREYKNNIKDRNLTMKRLMNEQNQLQGEIEEIIKPMKSEIDKLAEPMDEIIKNIEKAAVSRGVRRKKKSALSAVDDLILSKKKLEAKILTLKNEANTALKASGLQEKISVITTQLLYEKNLIVSAEIQYEKETHGYQFLLDTLRSIKNMKGN